MDNTKQGWISVLDQEPPAKGEFWAWGILCWDMNRTDKPCACVTHRSYGGIYLNDDEWLEDVTHWMPYVVPTGPHTDTEEVMIEVNHTKDFEAAWDRIENRGHRYDFDDEFILEHFVQAVAKKYGELGLLEIINDVADAIDEAEKDDEVYD